ncbi:MAG: hypothetical protein ACYC5Y_16005 [Symbiobacteriia bacterium]
MAKMAPEVDKRDQSGRWLPGFRPPGAFAPVVVDETKELILSALAEGATVPQAAGLTGVSEMAIWRAQSDDAALREAIQTAILTRRLKFSEKVGAMAEDVLGRMEDELKTLKPGEVQQLATSVGILCDKEAALAGVRDGGKTPRVRLAVSDKILALEVD